MLNTIDIQSKIKEIKNYWEPLIIAQLNGQFVKIAKFLGEFVWHSHNNEDELFYVLDGEFEMQFREGSFIVRKNQMIVVPAGVEHRPIAHMEAIVMLFEPISTLKMGD